MKTRSIIVITAAAATRICMIRFLYQTMLMTRKRIKEDYFFEYKGKT